jgi:hypothetical protein
MQRIRRLVGTLPVLPLGNALDGPEWAEEKEERNNSGEQARRDLRRLQCRPGSKQNV